MTREGAPSPGHEDRTNWLALNSDDLLKLIDDAVYNTFGLAFFQSLGAVGGPFALDHCLGHLLTSVVTRGSEGDVER